MSVNKYNASTGELTNLASGSRIWTGSEAAYKAEKSAGTLPTNAIIMITDDETDTCHYSTDETFTGMYWIDGKKIYRKVVDCGTLPNAAQKNVPHNISNLDQVITIKGIATSGNTRVPMPRSMSSIASHDNLDLFIANTNIYIAVTVDYSTYSGIVILEYTKTTDD